MNNFISYIEAVQLNGSLLYALTFTLGACIASFIVCMAKRYKHRIEAEILEIESEIKNNSANVSTKHVSFFVRSSCADCKKTLPWYQNIPIISWTMLKGRSKCCNKKISAEYILGELWLAAVFLIGAVFIENPSKLLIFYFLTSATFLFGSIDKNTMTIPFPIVACSSIAYVIFLFYYNIYEIEGALIVLFWGYLLSLMTSLTNISNRIIGNGDLYVITFASSVLHTDIIKIFYFLLLASIIFAFAYFMHRGEDKPMGFALHSALAVVLLHHLN